MAYKNLFIDLDDTLWDIHINGKECLEEIYHDYGYNRFYLTFNEYYDVYMPSNNHLWSMYRKGNIKKDQLIVERFLVPLREFGIDDPEYAKRVSDDFLERTTRKTRLIDGTIDLLEYLKPRYRMHILSNGFREVQYKKIENSGLRPYFDKIILSEDAGINKPHVGMFTHALTNTNSRRDQTVMIGDSWEADIVGAYNSCIDQIWFNPMRKNALEFEPTFTVYSLEEIKAIL
ncbi:MULTISPECIES: YjjG family noncanonical pyrimidine nucleotidase [Proteiniphilum]|jgi:putative hydrolase of the HAD superfamily|uniref:YjjG family noncanonical pyrimidine nucleotidase n=1 Tax=Proteiniphilum TaxID=294702 RepID=UPI001EEB4CF6|nr:MULTISPECIES: YjjG family noncanonical pyrimidine nucleotidase [Proteiniphilum]ULB34600.1 YjjG family noncanonical pyrimidine nucleotidase [Proteiniphilum propionicum]